MALSFNLIIFADIAARFLDVSDFFLDESGISHHYQSIICYIHYTSALDIAHRLLAMPSENTDTTNNF